MFKVPARYVLVALVFWGNSTVPLLRVNLSIAIISMINSTYTDYTTMSVSNSSHDVCPGSNTSEEKHESSGPFEWDSVQQGSILGCYFYAYVATSSLGPWLARKVGFKLVVGIAVAMSSLLTLIMPLAAYQGIGFFIATRILLGGFQGAVMPAMMLALPPWTPAKRVSFVYSIVACGYPLGLFITLPISSLIVEYLSWEAVFYISGAISLLWSALWFLLVYDSPGVHPRISKGEKKFLEENMTRNTSSKGADDGVPWIKIVTSLPVWAIMISNFGFDWTVTVTTVLVPTYMTSVLNMNITSAGASSGLPFLFGMFVIVCTGKLAEILRDKTRLSLLTIRKIYVTVALGGPGLCILLLCYIGCDGEAATALLLATVPLTQFHISGTMVNVLDISPTFCGIIFGMTQALSLCSGFSAPIIAGFILQKNDILSGWQIIFWITSGINFSAAVFYLIFGSTDEQSWSKDIAKPGGKDELEHGVLLDPESTELPTEKKTDV